MNYRFLMKIAFVAILFICGLENRCFGGEISVFGGYHKFLDSKYFQDAEDDIKKLVPEGIVGRVPYKGLVSEVLYQLTGGLQAGMGYCGAKDINALQKAKFVKITTAGVNESHPHDVKITKEPPNYEIFG